MLLVTKSHHQRDDDAMDKDDVSNIGQVCKMVQKWQIGFKFAVMACCPSKKDRFRS